MNSYPKLLPDLKIDLYFLLKIHWAHDYSNVERKFCSLSVVFTFNCAPTLWVLKIWCHSDPQESWYTLKYFSIQDPNALWVYNIGPLHLSTWIKTAPKKVALTNCTFNGLVTSKREIPPPKAAVFYKQVISEMLPLSKASSTITRTSKTISSPAKRLCWLNLSFCCHHTQDTGKQS